MAQKIQVRRDTALNWESVNPTLSVGEFGYEIDTQKIKIGDGLTAWIDLDYLSGGGSELTINGYDIEENGEILRHTLDEFRSEKSNGDTFVITKDIASMVTIDTNGLIKKASEISSLGAGGESIDYDGNNDIDNATGWAITHAGIKLGEESPSGTKGLTATEQGIKGETKNNLNVTTSFYDVDINGLRTEGLQGNVEVTPAMIDIEDGQGKGVQIKHDRIILNDAVSPVTLFKPPQSGVIATHEWVTANGTPDVLARQALDGLMPYMSDLVEVNYNTGSFVNADLKVDNTTVPDSQDAARLLYNIDVREVKEIHYTGADYMVLDSTVQAEYKAILGIKADNSVHVLKDSTIITVNNTVTFSDVTIDVTDYDYISVCWVNVWNSTGVLPTLTLLTNAEPIFERSVIEFVERTTFSTHIKMYDYLILLNKNRYHEPAVLSSPIVFTIGIVGSFGYQNIFKLKGQSITLPPEVVMDRNSDDYEPTMWNTMYFYNEFGVVRLLIINSLS